MTIFHKNQNFCRINAKINRFLEKIYLISLQNLKAIGAVSIELSRKQKLTTYTDTRTQTHIHTFSADDFVFNVDHVYTKKNRNLTIDF